ncbi:hypothetical protein [Chromobacterium paludis]|uniref:Uncharacterized protein n=1 Tax=Chromobacterium paludis TaxID=2605945 RepID=A0A5C1DKS9_9NEIS|nr:hypothetical protein [Chromobacterium paludis]QEL56677.1 hypothetical protein FYK34_14455 [Chromobacterium paludis]
MFRSVLVAACAVFAFSCQADELSVASFAGGDLNLKQLAGRKVYLAGETPALLEAEQALLAPYRVALSSKEQAEVVVSTQYLAAFDDLGGKLTGDEALRGESISRFHLKNLQCLGSAGGSLLSRLNATPFSTGKGSGFVTEQVGVARAAAGQPLPVSAQLVGVLLEAGIGMFSASSDTRPKGPDCEQTYTQCPLSFHFCPFSEIAVTTAEAQSGDQEMKRYRWVTYKKPQNGVDGKQMLDRHLQFLRQAPAMPAASHPQLD